MNISKLKIHGNLKNYNLTKYKLHWKRVDKNMGATINSQLYQNEELKIQVSVHKLVNEFGHYIKDSRILYIVSAVRWARKLYVKSAIHKKIEDGFLGLMTFLKVRKTVYLGHIHGND